MGGVGCCTVVIGKESKQPYQLHQQQSTQSGSLLSCMAQINKKKQPIWQNDNILNVSNSQPTSKSQKQIQKDLKNQNLMQGIIIRQPNRRDLKYDTSDFEEDQAPGNDLDYDQFRKQQKLEIIADKDIVEKTRLSVYFICDELISKLPREIQSKSINQSRNEKWYKMITYYLNADIQYKVFKSQENNHISGGASEKKTKLIKNQNHYGPSGSYSGNFQDLKPIEFSNYARIGLTNFFETNPELFLSRLAKGPPPQYRWFAWTFIASKLKQKIPGDYEKYLRIGRCPENKHVQYEIDKDINRTFPQYSYFNEENIGQSQLKNVLEAYSVYKPEVGYCQSINFLAGFILMISGANEKQSFWFLYQILEKSHQQIPFDGLHGFYEREFPLLHQYMKVFDDLFQEWMPSLHTHFQNEGLHSTMWIQKWFMTCFLYSFPMDLCIRIWDNLLAYGTRFLFNVSLSILKSVEYRLLELDMAEINEFFKLFKRDDLVEQNNNQQIFVVEEIIENAQKIYIPNERLKFLFNKHKIQQRSEQNQRSIKRQTFTVDKKLLSGNIKQNNEDQQLMNKIPIQIKENLNQQDDDLRIDCDDQVQANRGNQSQRSLGKKKKKKKKKKNVGMNMAGEYEQLEMMINLQDQLVGGSAAITFSHARNMREEDIQLEDFVNENYTDIHNHGGARSEMIQEEQQAQSSENPQLQNQGTGEIEQRGVNQNNQNQAGSSMSVSVRVPINLVTYDDNITNRKKNKIQNQNEHKHTISVNSMGNPNGGLRSGEIHNSSDSIQFGNESGRFNDFVIQRESMNFKRIVQKSQQVTNEKKSTINKDDGNSFEGIKVQQLRLGTGDIKSIEINQITQQNRNNAQNQGLQSARVLESDINQKKIIKSQISSYSHHQQSNDQLDQKVMVGNLTRQINFDENNSENKSQKLNKKNGSILSVSQKNKSGQIQNQIHKGQAIGKLVQNRSIIKRSNDIIEESQEDLNDDDIEYNQQNDSRYIAQKKQQQQIKNSNYQRNQKYYEEEKDKNEDDDSYYMDDDSDVLQEKDLGYDNLYAVDSEMNNYHNELQIEDENFQVGIGITSNIMPQQNKNRIIGRGQTKANVPQDNQKNVQIQKELEIQSRADMRDRIYKIQNDIKNQKIQAQENSRNNQNQQVGTGIKQARQVENHQSIMKKSEKKLIIEQRQKEYGEEEMSLAGADQEAQSIRNNNNQRGNLNVIQQDSCNRSNHSSIIKCDERDQENRPSMYNMDTDMQA